MPTPVKRILVVKPSSLGDILHTFPALELLHRRFPEAELDWLVHPAFQEVLAFSPFPVARAILFQRKKLGKASTFPREFLGLARELRRCRYDLVIDFQGLLRSAVFSFLARGPRPVGFSRPRERNARWLYGRRCRVDMNQHAVERNVALVNQLLDMNEPVPNLALPRGRFPVQLPVEAEGRRLIGIIPGARWESKRFPPELFAAVMKAVRRDFPDVAFLLIGSPADRDDAERILKVSDMPGVFSLAGRTGIGEMMELLGKCELVISNDSGPIHAAAALGVPVFGFFGPTHPEWTGPYGAGHRVFRRELECGGCMRRHCPRGPVPACHGLDPESIAAAVAQQLSTGGRKQ